MPDTTALSLGGRIKRARQARKLSQEELALALGWGQSRIANYEGGKREPTLEDIDAISRALEISSRQLLFGAEQPEDQPSWTDVLAFSQAVGLGEGVEAAEYAETYKLKFRADSLARKRLRPGQLAVVYGKGDSMLPRVQSGDAILFDTGDTRPADEKLFVVMASGIAGNEYSVKRCRAFGDDVYFDALNPAGDHNWRKPRKMDDKRHPITIIGRVRWIGSWED